MKNINLIGISGRMESGKNTVASMIQFINRNNNYKVAYNVKDEFEGWNRGLPIDSAWQQKSFAGNLKQIASILTGIPVEKFEDHEFKKSLLGEDWDCLGQKDCELFIPGSCHTGTPFNEPMSVREFLQKLGTDALRDGLHRNVWVNSLFAGYMDTQGAGKAEFDFTPDDVQGQDNASPIYPKWIVTDMRFPNEIKAIKQRGGLTIRLTRNQHLLSGHISEIALDNAKFDYIIDNQNQSLEETFKSVMEMVYDWEIPHNKVK